MVRTDEENQKAKSKRQKWKTGGRGLRTGKTRNDAGQWIVDN
jgi:hypothetical protein